MSSTVRGKPLVRAAIVILCSSVLTPAMAAAQSLTFDEAVQMAIERAPSIEQARGKVSIADAEFRGAESWRKNPSLSVSSGPRFGADGTTVDAMFGAKQPIVFGGRPQARTDVAQARQSVARLSVAEEQRLVAVAAARAYATLLYWGERAALSARHTELLREIEDVAKRRQDVGDVGALDPSVARLARTRAEAASARVAASRVDAERTLRWLLGLAPDADVVLDGRLQDVARQEASTESVRSDVALARARIQVAAARRELAGKQRFPGLAVGAMAGREESATVVRGVLDITLPLFWRGQPERLIAAADEEALTTNAALTERSVAFEVSAARQKVATLDAAVARFAEEGLGAVEKTSSIAAASYRAGAIPLPELLTVQRELVSAEEEFAQLLLLAAQARIELLSSIGAFNSNTTRN